jgi:hypothetical protein
MPPSEGMRLFFYPRLEIRGSVWVSTRMVSTRRVSTRAVPYVAVAVAVAVGQLSQVKLERILLYGNRNSDDSVGT